MNQFFNANRPHWWQRTGEQHRLWDRFLSQSVYDQKNVTIKPESHPAKAGCRFIFIKFGLQKSSSQHVIPGQIPTIINNVCQIYKTRKIISQKVDASKIHEVLVFHKENLIKPFPVYLPICTIKYGGNKPEDQHWNLSPTNCMLSILTKFSSLEDIANWPHRVIHG